VGKRGEEAMQGRERESVGKKGSERMRRKEKT
jgi:hypothetical protein